MVGLLRTIQLDASDKILFTPAAEPGEWAVTGGFMFLDRPFASLAPKERVAFRSGFLGVSSFGYATLAVVTPVSAAEIEAATAALADNLVRRLGAPSLEIARRAAAEEIAFASDLCRNHVEGQLIALHREEDATGALSERFRALHARAGSVWDTPELQGHERPFQFVETDAPEDLRDDPLAPTPADETFDMFQSLRPQKG